MTIRLSKEVGLILDTEDMLSILTDALCDYGTLSELQASAVNYDESGGVFTVSLMPKPKKPARTPVPADLEGGVS